MLLKPIQNGARPLGQALSGLFPRQRHRRVSTNIKTLQDNQGVPTTARQLLSEEGCNVLHIQRPDWARREHHLQALCAANPGFQLIVSELLRKLRVCVCVYVCRVFN
jgi:hypothetical protein